MLHQVGVGVLGPVFRTYDPVRDRLVSVKAFQLDLLPEQAQALAAELERIVALDVSHPSVVHRVGAGVEGHVVYLAEDYVAAESLDIALRHYAPAPLETALPFIAQLAGAIDAARAAGIRHGTLHPRDIFLTPEEARATGFGVADALEAVGVAAPVRRPYSAPERVARAAWDTPADVYALGAVAHELLTGRRPAGTGEVAPIAGKTAASHPQLIRAVLALAIAEDPADRYQTAGAFADALEAAARGEEVAPEPVLHLDRGEPARSDAGGEVVEEVPIGEVPEEEAAWDGEEARGPNAGQEPSLFDLSVLDKVSPSSPAIWSAGQLDEGQPEPERDSRSRLSFERDAGEDEGEPEPEPEPERAHAVAAPDEGDDAGPMWGHDEPDDAPVVVDRGRGVILPYAALLVVGLLVGFLAGYGLGSREAAPAPVAAEGESAPAPEASAQGEAAQPFSEAAVDTVPEAPAAEPPPAAVVAPPTPPPNTPAPAGPPGARLVIRSTPAGARVRVNGAERGETPLTLRGLAFGAYGIEVRREGYRNASRQVTLTEQLPTRELTFQLERAATSAPPRATPSPAAPARPAARTGTLVADSRPRGARVFVDNRAVGTTPFRLTTIAPGRHEVRLELAGYRAWRTEITIVAGSETRVSGSLERESP